MNVSDVLQDRERTVAIVHFRSVTQAPPDTYNEGGPIQNPAILLQVSLIASKVSPSGKFIRLGETNNDEIMGWAHIDALEVVEILGELGDDGKTVTPIVPRETLEFPNAAHS